MLNLVVLLPLKLVVCTCQHLALIGVIITVRNALPFSLVAFSHNALIVASPRVTVAQNGSQQWQAYQLVWEM